MQDKVIIIKLYNRATSALKSSKKPTHVTSALHPLINGCPVKVRNVWKMPSLVTVRKCATQTIMRFKSKREARYEDIMN